MISWQAVLIKSNMGTTRIHTNDLAQAVPGSMPGAGGSDPSLFGTTHHTSIDHSHSHSRGNRPIQFASSLLYDPSAICFAELSPRRFGSSGPAGINSGVPGAEGGESCFARGSRVSLPHGTLALLRFILLIITSISLPKAPFLLETNQI